MDGLKDPQTDRILIRDDIPLDRRDRDAAGLEGLLEVFLLAGHLEVDPAEIDREGRDLGSLNRRNWKQRILSISMVIGRSAPG